MDKSNVRCYISLGSNLEDPVYQVQTAIATLKTIPRSNLIRVSQLYSNPPMGPPDQPFYINAVASMDTQLSCEQLLQQLLQIETAQGRVRTANDVLWGPRVIDLDILLYGDAIINLPDLIIPHPGIAQRNFVLYPLAELDPNLKLPNNISLKSLLAKCSPAGLKAVTT